MSMNAVPNDPPAVAGGGEPPYDNAMDRRLTVLETRFDTILPTLATKADLEALRAEVHVGFEKLRADIFKANSDSNRWMIGVAISLFIGILAVNVAMFNAINSKLTTNLSNPSPVNPGSVRPTSPAPILNGGNERQ